MAQRYFQSLDGVRAVAVIAVALVHWGYFGAGWIGVQIFFVLSGYLISSNLLRDRELTNSFGQYIKNFYWRRFLRIFPIYYAYVAVFLLVGEVASSSGARDLVLPLLTYTVNIYAILPAHANLSNVGHFWSLAVEEQFYLLWPLLVYFIPKPLFRLGIVAVVLAAPALRLGVFVAWVSFAGSTHIAGEALNFLTIFQVDSFATGAAVALFSQGPSEHARKVFWGVFGFGCFAGALNLLTLLSSRSGHNPWVILSTFGYPYLMLENFQFVWGYSLLNIISGTLVWSIVCGKNPLPFLNSRTLKYLGRISYGIYVFHVPVLALVRRLFPFPITSFKSAIACMLYLTVTIAVSHVSYQYFEKWFMRHKDRYPILPAAPTASCQRDSGVM